MMMKKLLEKLNYKGQPRIAILNSDSGFFESLSAELKNVIIDKVIDPRCPYSFILIFAKSISEVEDATPVVLHNLTADGILWFCYPKKSSRNLKSDINRDNGWESLSNSGFHGIRLVSIDDDWSALRFRHTKYIKPRAKQAS